LNFKVQAPKGELSGIIQLPVSKSIFNRYLIMHFLSGSNPPDKSEKYPDDVNILIGSLNPGEININFGDAGTAMRFGTALFSGMEGKRTLSGSVRMHERPIAPLVNALKELGAEINYLDKTGFPPLLIEGKKLRGGEVLVPANVSSQYISALLMIAPTCENEVSIELSGNVVSYPYINMTLALMKEMGVEVEVVKNKFIIQPQAYLLNKSPIENDWSSASFIYQIAALSASCNVLLSDLKMKSIQGDRSCLELFDKIGVKSTEEDAGIRLIKDQNFKIETELTVDFTEIPDLVQPFVMTCTALGIDLLAKGLYNLHIKESNRLKALQFNVQSLGGEFNIDGTAAILKAPKEMNSSAELKVFNDHRMAMALVPLALKLTEVNIENPGVVKKSFPNYWNELKKLGFEIDDFI